MIDRRRFLVGCCAVPGLLLGCERQAAPALSPLAVGEPMPALELPGLDGRIRRLAPGDGPCLVNFWATWCPPCRAEMASLDRAYRVFVGRGLKVLGISVDTDAYLADEYVRQAGLAFPILLDAGAGQARRDFRVTAYPTSFLVDPAGRIAEVRLGAVDWDATPVRARLASLLDTGA